MPSSSPSSVVVVVICRAAVIGLKSKPIELRSKLREDVCVIEVVEVGLSSFTSSSLSVVVIICFEVVGFVIANSKTELRVRDRKLCRYQVEMLESVCVHTIIRDVLAGQSLRLLYDMRTSCVCCVRVVSATLLLSDVLQRGYETGGLDTCTYCLSTVNTFLLPTDCLFCCRKISFLLPNDTA